MVRIVNVERSPPPSWLLDDGFKAEKYRYPLYLHILHPDIYYKRRSGAASMMDGNAAPIDVIASPMAPIIPVSAAAPEAK